MSILQPGAPAPPIPGVDLSAGPTAVFFYKFDCPVCRTAAPAIAALVRAYPGRVVGVGQDPPERLAWFQREFAPDIPSPISDLPPYEISEAYGVEVVPTLFLGAGGEILEAVESWNRDAYNDVARRLADLAGMPFEPASPEGDGLPIFRPG